MVKCPDCNEDMAQRVKGFGSILFFFSLETEYVCIHCGKKVKFDD